MPSSLVEVVFFFPNNTVSTQKKCLSVLIPPNLCYPMCDLCAQLDLARLLKTFLKIYTHKKTTAHQ